MSPSLIRYTTSLCLTAYFRDELHSFSIYDEFHFGYIRSDNNQLHFRTEGAHDKTLIEQPAACAVNQRQIFQSTLRFGTCISTIIKRCFLQAYAPS
jgi:hypothetical protein